jgi:hypothetical protein
VALVFHCFNKIAISILRVYDFGEGEVEVMSTRESR